MTAHSVPAVCCKCIFAEYAFCSEIGWLKLNSSSSGLSRLVHTGKESQRGWRAVSMPTECVHQTSSGNFMNGYYAMLSPSISPADWKDTISGKLAPPTVYVYYCVNETDYSHQKSLAKT